MKIGKVWINRSIQNHTEVWGKFYIVVDDDVQRIWVTRKRVERGDDSRLAFDYKDCPFVVYHDLDRHLVCFKQWRAGSSLIFKNFWFAHGYQQRLKRKK